MSGCIGGEPPPVLVGNYMFCGLGVISVRFGYSVEEALSLTLWLNSLFGLLSTSRVGKRSC